MHNLGYVILWGGWGGGVVLNSKQPSLSSFSGGLRSVLPYEAAHRIVTVMLELSFKY